MMVTPAFAQQQMEVTKTLKCSNAEYVFKLFKDDFGETPVWVGKDKGTDTYIALLKNKEKGTWTLVQYDSVLACVLGAGEQGTPI
jgi:hypothetical protein